MFEGFADQWTPLLPSGRASTRPRRVQVAGTGLVVWRPAPGKRPGVLLDRCPHRGVSLALGKRAPDGSLACAFHGWEFGPDGACRYVPFNPDAPRHRLGATPLPVREEAGFVWVFTGFDEGKAAAGPSYPETLADRGLARHDHAEVWDCHWTRAMENMLDFPHLPYIHRTTIGRFVRAKMTRTSRLRLALDTTPTGFDLESRVDEHPPGASLQWWRPHGMVLDTVPEPRMMRLYVWCVPVDDRRTRMILTSQRNVARGRATSVGVNAFNRLVLRQDRDVVESSDPAVVPDRGVERSVPTDSPTLTFRTWYLRNLAESSVTDPRT